MPSLILGTWQVNPSVPNIEIFKFFTILFQLCLYCNKTQIDMQSIDLLKFQNMDMSLVQKEGKRLEQMGIEGKIDEIWIKNNFYKK